MMKIIFFLLLSVQALAQLQPLNVPGDTQREINTKARNNFNYLETRTDSIVANLSGGPGGETYNGDPTVIVQDVTHRFATDAQITDWNDHAETDHNHDALYQPLGDYALSTHNHDASYSAINHNHDAVYQPLGSYALSTHNHDAAYAALTHEHDLSGDRGDITNTGTNGMTWTIDANAVTTTKINNSAVTGAKIAPSTITDSDVNDVAWGKITGAPSFALSTHNHDGVYQPVGSYSLTTHNHDGVYQPVGSYSLTTHNHDAVYQPLGSYALSTHNHDLDYADIDHNHTGVYEPEGDYALTSHNHAGVYQPVGSYALTTHNHDGTYATPAQVDAKIEDNITDGATTTAPSENAVFDALTGKQATLVSGTNIKTVEGNSLLGSTDIDLIQDNLTDGDLTAPTENAVFDALATKQATLVSGTNIKTINGSSVLGSGDLVVGGGSGTTYAFSRVTGSNATTTGQTLVNVTGLSNALDANSVYEFEAVLMVNVSAVTTGTGYGVNFSAAGATIESQISGTLTSGSAKTARINAFNTISAGFLTTSGVNGGILIKGIVATGANAGNLTIQHVKTTSGTSTVYINSFLKTTKLP